MINFRHPNFLSSKLFIALSVVAVIGIGFLPLQFFPEEIGGLISMLLVLLSIFFVGRLRGKGLKEIGLRKPKNWLYTIWLGFVYALVIFFVFRVCLEPLLESIVGSERDMSRFDFLKGNLSETLKMIVTVWITAAFFEEVFFRGFLITYVSNLFNKRSIGDVIAIALSSLFFAFVHGYQGFSGMILTGLAALFFAYIFIRHRGNLWIAIAAHGITDTSGVLLVFSDSYEAVTSLIF